jgi:hypothetical protein
MDEGDELSLEGILPRFDISSIRTMITRAKFFLSHSDESRTHTFTRTTNEGLEVIILNETPDEDQPEGCIAMLWKYRPEAAATEESTVTVFDDYIDCRAPEQWVHIEQLLNAK